MRPALALVSVLLVVSWRIVAGPEATASEYRDWSVNPAVPGPNLPPAGRSYFDYLVGDKVPFPFTALEAKVSGRIAVLIPLGRSLQRNAAKPEFFQFPRAVVAAGADSDEGLPLKDRLFLGFQEKAGILEVISYNEAAGRFEFQLVNDYRAGGNPRVKYADRAICTGCHQNHAPIFPRQLWDETNANPKIAELLSREKRNYYGISVDRGVDVPYAIDNAVARANAFSSTQLLWREACGDSRECRAEVLAAALQFRLSGYRYYDTQSPGYLQASNTIEKQWNERWPRGLNVPGSSIPNRNPLVKAYQSDGRSLIDELIRQQASIEPRFEPAIRRPALETWSSGQAMPKLISGIAEFVTAADIRELDQALSKSRIHPATYTSRCKSFTRSRAAQMDRVEFRCSGSNLSVDALFYVQGQNVTRGTVAKLARGSAEASDLQIEPAPIRATGETYETTVPLMQKDSGLHAREADGNIIESIRFRWTTGGQGFATVMVRNDFTQVVSEIGALPADALSAKPFRRAITIRSLFERLGIEAKQWCCI
ncbi:MAG: hypothetical protein M3Z36_09320 [Acidobacteriota bacterium]|nr:hypothetical protein [Acidobacteriota bacterium]